MLQDCLFKLLTNITVEIFNYIAKIVGHSVAAITWKVAGFISHFCYV